MRSDLPCQDRFACFASEGVIAIAIADGAGSAIHAETGAQLAVEEAIGSISSALSVSAMTYEDQLVEAGRAARHAVLSRAIEDGNASRDYACTLLLICMTPGGGAALQLGDGVIAYRDCDGWAAVFWPQKGQYANMTHFLSDDDAEERWEVARLPSPDIDIAVLSDGLEQLALHMATRSIHEPFMDAVLAPLKAAEGAGEATHVSRALGEFLASPRIADRADDDLTLCLATRL